MGNGRNRRWGNWILAKGFESRLVWLPASQLCVSDKQPTRAVRVCDPSPVLASPKGGGELNELSMPTLHTTSNTECVTITEWMFSRNAGHANPTLRDDP